MRRRRSSFFASFGIWFLVAVLDACVTVPASSPIVSEPKHSRPVLLRLERWGGGTLDMSSARGRWALLSIFTSSSLRAQAEMPLFSRLIAQYGSERLVVLGVCVDLDSRLAGTYLELIRPGFPVAISRMDDPRLVAAVGRTLAVPRTLLIDPKGRIVQDHHQGRTDFAAIERELAVKKGSR